MKYDEMNNIYEFDSMSDYIKTITTHKNPKCVGGHSDRTDSSRWYGTRTFDEAIKLATEGWTECAERLNKNYNVAVRQENDKYFKTFLSQAGYQAIVPLWLNGCPNNMMNRKMEVKKQKVLTIVKSVGFRADASAEQIEEESIKTLVLVNMLEKKGYRVNLYTLNGFRIGWGRPYFVRVKIKAANERLNISKLAFPLVHPSMLRRLNFKFREVFCGSDMGGSLYTKSECEKAIRKGEIFVPSFMKMSIDDIKNISDVEDGLTVEEKRGRW